MSEIRINARQRKVIKIALVLAAALLLLGLIIEAYGEAVHPAGNTYAFEGTATRWNPGYWSFNDFLLVVLRSPRLYIAGLLVGLAVFIHRGPKDEKA